MILAKRCLDDFEMEGIKEENHSIMEFAINISNSDYSKKPKYITFFPKKKEMVGGIWTRMFDESKGKPVTLLRNIFHKNSLKCNCCGESLIDKMYLPLGRVETKLYRKVQVASGLNICEKCLMREFEANKSIIIATMV